ncbi:hypothetical protein [Tenacibaculum sp. M341]|uniref:hypothetical protein n=1 Tax=Tenacibaculum sp. M341 TaxID=2530339 RepID=UPI001048568E|nr:hypothetical protein [Tenacibaculum sp. M341]TCI90718.1 hypothetical protein EYW44_13430 [Tenacibaculum sp. M341]
MKLYKITFLLLLLPIIGFANKPKDKHEKTKNISKRFEVKNNATLYVNNKYGNVTVTTWEENTIQIDVKILVKGSNIEKVNDKLDGINVVFESSESLVEARTRIEDTKSSWSWWGNSYKNISYKINYYIKMPKTNNADLHNKYGGIELDVLEGRANIDCDYGSIQIEKLLNDGNSINLGYCGNSTINYMKSGNIRSDYSKLSVNESNDLKVNADYSGIKIGTTKEINFNCDYGSIAIKNADFITGNSDYAGMQIGTVTKDLNINTDYGGLKIKNLAKGFQKVYIDGSYAGIKIGTPSNNNFDFILNLSYAGFSYPDESVNMKKSIKKISKKYYEGSYGNSETGSKIEIKSNYGGVSLKVND